MSDFMEWVAHTVGDFAGWLYGWSSTLMRWHVRHRCQRCHDRLVKGLTQ